MTYLYGDQTPSPLQTNFLAWLGDAMEFCIHLVLAEQRLESLRAEGRALEDHAVTLERLRRENPRSPPPIHRPFPPASFLFPTVARTATIRRWRAAAPVLGAGRVDLPHRLR